ncbi:DUF6344 domain-containing protein [Streptomyces sp. NPDC050600]|uniref:DUF6344 domain-containing protein n=1 Tax=Streptomyces sp. NPDC050600 TaxID=3157213 RepID=UPI0034179B69
MATAKVKQFWTAFISVLFALFASLGLASPATAAQQPALQQGEEPAVAGGAGAVAARPAVSVPAQRSHQWRTAQGRALPPTIKQRIGAEAHGSSPAVRHLRADTPAGSDLAGTDPAAGSGDLTGPALRTKTARGARGVQGANDARTARAAHAAYAAHAAHAVQTAQTSTDVQTAQTAHAATAA